MKAAQLVLRGAGPAGIDVRDVPAPEPAPDELLVRVHAVSAAKLELEQTMAGVGLGRAVRLPRVLGMDPAGVVIAQGAAVAQNRIGQRVAIKPNLVCGTCRYCADGVESDCVRQQVLGTHRDGGAAEYVAVPARSAFVIDDAMPFDVAAATVHTVAVALHLLRRAGEPEPGTDVLVLGASGAVGSATVQLAATAGANVIGAVRDGDKAEQARTDGAMVTVDSAAPDALAAAVRAIRPDGVAVVIDTTGNAALLGAGMQALAWRGTAVTCASRAGERLAIDAGALYRGRQSLLGAAASDHRDVREALSAVASGTVRPRIGARFPLAAAAQAYRTLAGDAVTGKVMIAVTD